MRFLVGCVVTVFRLLPQWLAVRIGLGLGWSLLHLARFRRRVVRLQLRAALGADHTAAELQAILGDFYRHLGLLVVELLRLPGISGAAARSCTVFHGEEHLKRALASGRGVILVCGHVGNFELAAIALAARGYRVGAVVKEMKVGIGEVFLTRVRDDNGVVTIPRRRATGRIFRLLRENGIVVLLIDQNMTADEGVFVDFLGHPACTLKGVPVLARRSGAAVVPGYTVRDADRRRHHCVAAAPLELVRGTGTREEDLTLNTARITKALEEIIRQHPAQWLWLHKRWKTRPPDEERNPFDYG